MQLKTSSPQKQNFKRKATTWHKGKNLKEMGCFIWTKLRLKKAEAKYYAEKTPTFWQVVLNLRCCYFFSFQLKKLISYTSAGVSGFDRQLHLKSATSFINSANQVSTILDGTVHFSSPRHGRKLIAPPTLQSKGNGEFLFKCNFYIKL